MNQKTLGKLIKQEDKLKDGYIYSYQLTMREGCSTADWRMPLYSIKVDMTDSEGNKTSSDAKDIFSSLDKAIQLFDKIVRNLATPIDLAYIIEDELEYL